MRIPLRDGVIDLERSEVRRETVVRLTRLEAKLLAYLAKRPGHTCGQPELLASVWGYSPHTVSRTVEVTVQRIRRKIESDPSSPVHLCTTWGEGYRLEPAQGEVEPLGDLVGRRGLLDAIHAAWGEGARIVTLTGTGGVGKTRVARQIARTATGPSWFCALQSARTADELWVSLAVAVGVPLDPPTATAGRLGIALQNAGHALLVADNLEQLPAAGTVLEELVSRAPDLRILATSRAPLGSTEEHALRLEGLPEDDGLALLLARCERSTAGDAEPALRGIVRLLDGLPLALELAAPRLSTVAPPVLQAALEERLSLLRDRRRSGRHAAMEAVIETSWEALTTSEQQALVRLATFQGGFVYALAEKVLQDLDAEPVDLLEVLEERSLLYRVLGPWRPRFEMYVVVRAFALDRLNVDTRVVAERRHAHAVLDHLEAELEPPAWRDQRCPAAEAEEANLHAAQRRLGTDAALAPRFAACAWSTLRQQGKLGPLASILEESAAAVPAGSLDAVRILTHLSKARRTPETRWGLEALERAAVAATEHVDPGLDALIALHRSESLRWAEEDAAAEEALERALAAAREAKDPYLEARIIGFGGVLACERGDLERAQVSFHAALAGHRAAGDPAGVFVRLSNLGFLYARLGDYASAEDYYRQAIEAGRDYLDRDPELIGTYLGSLRLAQGSLDEARSLLTDARAAHLARGAAHYGAMCQVDLARIDLELGHHAAAWDALEEAISVQRRSQDSRQLAVALTWLGWTLLDAGRQSAGRERLDEALAVLEAARIGEGAGRALLGVALADALQGALEQAADRVAEARSASRRESDLRTLAVATVLAAALERRVGAAAPALAEEAASLLQRTQHPWARELRAIVERQTAPEVHSVEVRLLAVAARR